MREGVFMSATEFNTGNAVKKTILNAAISILISTVVCLVGALIFSAGAPVGYIETLGWIICGITGLIGGLMTAKSIRKKCVLFGILCGFFAFIIIFAVGLFFGNGVAFSKLVIKLAVCLFTGALGGFLGAGNKRRRSRAH